VFTLLRTLSLAYLGQRWTRTMLLIASIALGVATLVATRSLHDALKRSARDVVSPMTGLADLVIVNGQSGVPKSVLPALRDPTIPGVAELRPLVFARASLPDRANAQTWILGLDVSLKDAETLDKDAGRFDLDVKLVDTVQLLTRALRYGKLALATPALADKGEALRLRATGREATVGLLGTVDVKEKKGLSVLGDNVVFTDLDTAGLFATPDRPGTLTQVNVKLAPGADAAAVQAELQRRVGVAATVQTAEANFAQYFELAAGLELGFLLGSAGALVVGVFLIYNVLSVGVAERRHDIGVLRSVGATRGQIASLFVAEAFGLGLVGSLLGLPIGWAIAWFALGPMGQLISEMYLAVDARNLDVSLWTLGISLLAGVGTAVIAALVPALQAAREEPADAVRRVPRRSGGFLVAMQVAAVVGLIGCGLGFTLYREQLPVRFGAFAGIVCLLVGALVATPLLAAGFAWLLQTPTRRLLGLEGRLAADNLFRSPGRTGLVVAALAATTALVVQTAGFIHSSKLAIVGWIDEAIAADLFVTSGDNVTKLGVTLPMATTLAQEMEALPGVAAAVPVRFHRVDFRERIVMILAVDLRALAGKGLSHNPARDVEANPRLLEPGVASVSENFAALYKVKAGDRLTIPGPAGPVELDILGTYQDFSWNRGTILIDQAWYQATFGERVADVVDVYVKPGATTADVRRALVEKWGKSDALFATESGTFKGEIAAQLDRVYLFAYAQQGVIGIVALLGVVSALLISILQRRRELGLLRAVGASRPQVLRSVLAEAGLMGVIGAGIGLLVGLVLEWYVVRILILDEAGFLFDVAVPWVQVGVIAGLAVLLPLVVGVWPALQATRVGIADAIAYE